MASESALRPLGSVAKVRSGFAFKSTDMGSVGSPIVKIKNVVPPAVDISDCERVPEEVIAKIPNVDRFALSEGDILIAMTGATVGKVGKFPQTAERHYLNQRVGKVYLTKPDEADYQYIYYILSQDIYVRQMLGAAGGSAQPNISGGQIEDLQIPLPPLPEQKAIARILGTLDDKIELNRRMNATLEAMARALFQSWFVDFDPVRRNMEAQACLSGRQAATNPIPDAAGSWFTYAIKCQGGSVYIGQTDNLRRRWAQHVDGKGAEWTRTHPPVALVFWETHDSLEKAIAREKWLKSGSGREWLKQEIAARSSVHLPAGEAGAKAALPVGQTGGRHPAGMDPQTAALFPDSFQDSELGEIPEGWAAGTLGDVATNPRRSVQPDEIAPHTPYIALEHMPRRSIALSEWETSAKVESGKTAFQKGEILFGKLRPYFHKVGVAPASGVCSTDILVLAPSKPEWFGFLLGHASSDAAIQFADKHSTGTKMPRTNWADLKSFKIALPPLSIAKAFNDQMQPLIAQIHANLHQSHTLATLRDTLLPKLLSGEKGVQVSPN